MSQVSYQIYKEALICLDILLMKQAGDQDEGILTLYRTFYCGLCRELREKYGISGQITLSYDMTFVIMLLSGLYEPKTYKGTTRCILHPVRKQPVRKNVMTEYCADHEYTFNLL